MIQNINENHLGVFFLLVIVTFCVVLMYLIVYKDLMSHEKVEYYMLDKIVSKNQLAVRILIFIFLLVFMFSGLCIPVATVILLYEGFRWFSKLEK